jgi:hypothetical protein
MGTLTTNKFALKPPWADSSADATAFGTAADKLDTRLGTVVYVGDPVITAGTTLAHAITYMNALSGGGTLVIPKGAHAIAADTSVDADVTLMPLPGAVVTIAIGATWTILGHVVDTMSQWIVDSSANLTMGIKFPRGSVEFVRPEWWGAKGDGLGAAQATANTTAFNLACNCGSGYCAPTIQLSSGAYYLDGTVAITYDGQVIQGTGWQYPASKGGTEVIAISTLATHMFTVAVTRTKFFNLSIVGNAEAIFGISATSGGSYGTIANCLFRNFSGPGVSIVSTNIWHISNNIFSGGQAGSSGIYADGYDSTIVNNFFEGNGIGTPGGGSSTGYGVFIKGSGLICANNWFYDLRYAIYNSAGANASQNNQIMGNNIRDCDYGIYGSFTRSLLANNQFYDVWNCGIHLGIYGYNNINGNQFIHYTAGCRGAHYYRYSGEPDTFTGNTYYEYGSLRGVPAEAYLTYPIISGEVPFLANNTTRRTIAPSATAPKIESLYGHKTRNNAATTIASLTTGANGKIVDLLFGDSMTTIDFTETLMYGNKGVDYVSTPGDRMIATYRDGVWQCRIEGISEGMTLGAELVTNPTIYPGLDSELVVDGAFTGGISANWTVGDGWTGASNQAVHAAYGGTAALSQTIGGGLTASGYYVLTVYCNFDSFYRPALTVNLGNVAGVVHNTQPFRMCDNGTTRRFWLQAGTATSLLEFLPTQSFVGIIDTVSLKKLTVPANWTLNGTGEWVSACDNDTWGLKHVTGVETAVAATATVSAASVYLVTLEISGMTLGNLTPTLGGVAGAAVTANGYNYQRITAGADGDLTLTPSTDFNGLIRNASVKLIS